MASKAAKEKRKPVEEPARPPVEDRFRRRGPGHVKPFKPGEKDFDPDPPKRKLPSDWTDT